MVYADSTKLQFFLTVFDASGGFKECRHKLADSPAKPVFLKPLPSKIARYMRVIFQEM